jgi:hypothetical protein
LGCLKAFAKTTFEKKFYDLDRVHMNGDVEFGFDAEKVYTPDELKQQATRKEFHADVDYAGTVPVYGTEKEGAPAITALDDGELAVLEAGNEPAAGHERRPPGDTSNSVRAC